MQLYRTMRGVKMIEIVATLLLLLQIAPPPPLTARWDGPGRATITWQGAGCLYRNQVLIACYPRDASYVLELGGPFTDGAFRPTSGDVYRLWGFDGALLGQAEIRSVVYLAAFY